MANLEKVTKIELSIDCQYSGWGYYKKNIFIPHGCGKKYYNDHYEYGNFDNGVLNGPAIISHNISMFTSFFTNGINKGIGFQIEKGQLTEFGYYEDYLLINDLTDYVYWFFVYMRNRWEKNILSVNMDIDIITKNVTKLTIGNLYTGFHFISNGSLYVGQSYIPKLTGNFICFTHDGEIKSVFLKEEKIEKNISMEELVNKYYEVLNEFSYKEKITNIPKTNIDFRKYIIQQYNCDNEYSIDIEVFKIDFEASKNAKKIKPEIWEFGDKWILTPHGNFEVTNLQITDDNNCEGIIFNVKGKLQTNNFTCSIATEEDLYLTQFTLMNWKGNNYTIGGGYTKPGYPRIGFVCDDKREGVKSFWLRINRKLKYQID